MNKTTSFIFFWLLLRVSRVLARGLGSFSKDLEIKIVSDSEIVSFDDHSTLFSEPEVNNC